jgi:malonyl-CoA O-methyltransferase
MSEAHLGQRRCHVEQNFSKSAHRYHEHALLQQICAGRLMAILQEAKMQIVPGDILEIGCGTGFITKQLFQLFAERKLCITDVSSTMLKTCEESLQGLHSAMNSSYEVLDGERFNSSKEYALIVAGLVFQWFAELEKSIDGIVKGLLPGGCLLFSILEAQSFPEWHQCCQELGLPYTGNRLPEISELNGQNETSLYKKTVWQETVKMLHPSAGHFFKHLKLIGANTGLSQQQLKPHEMKRLIQYWDAKCPEGVTITYNVVYSMYTAIL